MSVDIQISEKRGVRYLHFGSDWVQGAMKIRQPNVLELEYTRKMVSCLEQATDDWPQQVLIIGLGAGSLVKYIHKQHPNAQLTVVEIAPEVVIATQHYFKLPDSPRIDIQLGDGVAFLQQTKQCYDWILIDGYDAHGDVGELESEAFYQCCRDHLNPRGRLVVNILRESPGLELMKKTLQLSDEDVQLCKSGNRIVSYVAP